MNCSSVYIFRDENDRKNIEMYKKLAELVMRIDDVVYPDCLAVSKRADKFASACDEILLTDKERRRSFKRNRQIMKILLNTIKQMYKNLGFDISKYEAVYGSNQDPEVLKELWNELCYWVKQCPYLAYNKNSKELLFEAFTAYCSTYKECDLKTKRGDIFMWVSGKDHAMNIDTLKEAAKTPEEMELVSKVMIGFTQHCKSGEWFEDMDEPKLPSWEDKYGTDEAV